MIYLVYDIMKLRKIHLIIPPGDILGQFREKQMTTASDGFANKRLLGIFYDEIRQSIRLQ